ncbi:MAG: hypothetical protein AB1545_14025 [Thermodesulfobacteriota bacterium]
MINLNTVYGKTTLEENADFSSLPTFWCEHCGQKYTPDVLHLAVSLYGIFFLVGDKKGYLGITCPSCLKTILAKGDTSLVRATRDNLLDFENKLLPPLNEGLSYNSSVVYSLDHIPGIGKFNILSFACAIKDRPELIEDGLVYQLDDYSGYLCSYLFGIDLDSFPQKLPPQGAYFLVLFFRENQIEDLVELERKTGQKIFPRYYFKNDLIDATEKFCWENFLCLESLKRAKNPRQERIEQVESQITNSVSLTSEFLEMLTYDYSNFNSFAKNYPELRVAYAKYLKDNNLEPIADDQLNNLLNYYYAKLYTNMFWMYLCKNPFSKQKIPTTSFRISHTEFPENIALRNVEAFSKEALKYKDKVYTQSFLKENYDSFIKEYVDIARRRTFSLADFFFLHEEFLNALHREIAKGRRNEAEYAFFKEGDTWTIIFEGKSFRGLRGLGYEYIHYMINRPGESFSHFELDRITNGFLVVHQYISSNNNDINEEYTKEEPEDEYCKIHYIYGSTFTTDGLYQTTEVQESEVELKDKIYWCESKVKEIIEQEGENSNNLIKLKELLAEYKNDLFYKKKKIKAKEDSTQLQIKTKAGKQIQNKVANSIIRAIEKVEKIAEKSGLEWQSRAHKHLKESFPKPYADKIGYQPMNNKIDWHK